MIEAFVIVFCLALSTSLVVMPICVALGHRWGIVAIPGGRRKHEGQISKLGGIAVFAGFMIAALGAQFLPIPRFDPNELIRFTGLMLGAVLIFIVGLLDDKYELNALQLGIAQIFTAGIAIGFQIFIETVNNPITAQQTDRFPFLVTVTLSMFWFGVMINTVNFLDGIDGLAGGVAFICSLMLFIHSAFILNQTSVSLLPLALMGASLGFLLYNFNPAKIFLGGGAYLLGYLIGVLSIIGGAKMATILMVMGLPLMDFAWQVISRIRRGKNPMQGDRGHLHFRLLDLGYGQRSIVVVYYLFCACFGILTLVITSQLFKLIAFITMLILIIAGFAMVARRENRALTSSPLPVQSE